MQDTQPQQSQQARTKVQFLEVFEAGEGQRLDNFLIRHLKGVPRSRIYRIIRKGEVRVNKKRAKPEKKLSLGDLVRIPPITLAAREAPAKVGVNLSKYLQECVIHEQDEFLVLNKPAGLSVHGGTGVRLGLIEAMRQIKPQWAQLELAHRLDRDTSGCLIISKKAIFLKHITNELKVRNVNKTYMALVHGHWPKSLLEVTAPLLKSEISAGERMVKVDAEGKPSKTTFSIIKRFKLATLIKAMPETGRTHQIRVHCQSVDHSIAGDSKYTAPEKASQLPQARKLCLHAYRVEFSMPDDGERVGFEAQLNSDFEDLLKILE